MQAVHILWLALVIGLVDGQDEFMFDSDRIYGVREPEGFTRDNISCPAQFSILVTSVSFGYKNSKEIPLCGEEGTWECVTSLHPANVDCHENFCTFPSRSNWMEADFGQADSEQCTSETTLQYWHVCYDCMMHVAAMEAQV